MRYHMFSTPPRQDVVRIRLRSTCTTNRRGYPSASVDGTCCSAPQSRSKELGDSVYARTVGLHNHC